MEIVNKTKWDTKALRKLCTETLRRAGYETTHRMIEVKNQLSNCSAYSGLATIGSRVFVGGKFYENGWILMRVPPIITQKQIAGENGATRLIDSPEVFDSERFAQILIHEGQHNTGERHKDMMRSYDIDCSWAKNFSVMPTPEQVKPKRNIKQERYLQTLQHIKEWEAKKKRVETALKKYEAKKKYYEVILNA